MDYETLWLRVEAMVLGLMEQHGETRNSIGPKLGLGRNHLRRYLLTEEQRRGRRKVTPAFDLAFQVAEHFGVRPAALLAPFASDAPEDLLQLLPWPVDEQEGRRRDASAHSVAQRPYRFLAGRLGVITAGASAREF